jgi:hypothetical protein
MSSNKRDRLAAEDSGAEKSPAFRVIITGDRAWQCDELAALVVAALIGSVLWRAFERMVAN